MQYNPNSLWAGHRSAVRRGSGVTGRAPGAGNLLIIAPLHPAPRSFPKKAAPAAVQTPRFQKIASCGWPKLDPTSDRPTSCPIVTADDTPRDGRIDDGVRRPGAARRRGHAQVARRRAARAHPSRGRGECATRGTSADQNDHKTDIRRIQYPWHSLFGRDLVVRGSKAGRTGVLRCQVDDDDKRDNREIPIWMFDQVVCARMYHSSQPHVSWQALVELRRLLNASVRIDVRENVENESPPTTEGTDEAGTRTTESSASSRAVRSAERSAVVSQNSIQPLIDRRVALSGSESGVGIATLASSAREAKERHTSVLCHTCAMAARFGTERGGTGWAQMEFELNKSKAIDGNHVSCFGFSIALRGFESRPGHSN